MTDSAAPKISMPDVSEAVVFVVDSDEDMCQSMRRLLKSVQLAASLHASAHDFLDHYSAGQPGCLLVELRMPGMSGLDLLNHLRARNIEIPVIIMTGHGDVPTAVRALKSGALDFVQKPFNNQEMLERIQGALRLDQENRDRYLARQDVQNALARLTAREREILEYVRNGKSSKLIGRELDISPKTVDIHRTNVMKKLNVHHVTELNNIHSKCQFLERETASGFRSHR